MTRKQDKQHLEAIRHRLAVAPDIGVMVFGREITLEGDFRDGDGPQPIAEFLTDNRNAIAFVENAQSDIRFLLALIERASKTILSLANDRQVNPSSIPAGSSSTEAGDHPPSEPKNYAAECAMRCSEPAFRKFLQTRHGLGRATDEATAAKIREMLAMASRNQLNTDDQKRKLWRSLVREFNQWKERGK